MTEHPAHIDAQRWDPLVMKFTQYFGGVPHSEVAGAGVLDQVP